MNRGGGGVRCVFGEDMENNMQGWDPGHGKVSSHMATITPSTEPGGVGWEEKHNGGDWRRGTQELDGPANDPWGGDS